MSERGVTQTAGNREAGIRQRLCGEDEGDEENERKEAVLEDRTEVGR